ncbi:class I adenylate-forming enzyme family protein [Streptomyces sp. N50]|uniref:class I adenylate-forming enzyme family protein n=1 Tax=Streptomyces sp. N50 TaxID=3081765 RepID=UPI002962431C|nr:AMP-binding protein [Streptomyces sp. N50]WOX15387.1 AMP-binding protein [Streptomyces sp. N50]
MNRRPWLATYPGDLPREIVPESESMLELFASTVSRFPDRTAIAYFDGAVSFRDLDQRSDALAIALTEGGFAAGDRLALYTQNNPAFVVGLLAAWKAGGVAVLVNPMSKARELSHLLRDSGATALLSLDDLYVSVAREVLDGGQTEVRQVFVASARDDQKRDDQRVIPVARTPAIPGALRLTDVCARHDDRKPEPVGVDAEKPAVLTYTSGTTGVPKAAINTHGNLAFNTHTYREWMKLSQDDVVLGIAPLFHITGLVGHVCVSLVVGSELVLAHRFDGTVVLDAIREHRPTFTVGAITAFNHLSGLPGATKDDFASLRAVYSGGAPIAPQLRDKILARTGMDIQNCYGMTETTSPTHAVPLGVAAPVDPGTGALSIGVPVFNTSVRVIDDDGTDVLPGETGELVVSGPQVTPGYWNKPEETADKLVDGELHTGDMGLMDEDGWFYLVGRKSDMIIASGYKVWPREVEDVLLGHRAVREAAVIGVPDEYRGQTVKAFVSLQPGRTTSPDALIVFCRDRMAAYKYPRVVEIVDELPRSPAGKILRRELR